MIQPDLYKILGVSRDASAAEIKAAFRRQAKSAHPDHGGDRKEFEKLTMSKLVLLDPKRRAKYDETGEIDQAIDNEFAEIVSLAMAAIDEVLSVIERRNADPWNYDLLGDARQKLVFRIGEADQQQISLKMGVEKIGAVAERISAKKGKVNRLTSVFEARKTDLMRRAKQTESQIEKLKKAYDLLGEHDFKVELRGYP